VITLKNAGIRADYIEGLQEAGLTGFTVPQLIGLRDAGIDGDFIEGLGDLEGLDLTPESLAQLRQSR